MLPKDIDLQPGKQLRQTLPYDLNGLALGFPIFMNGSGVQQLFSKLLVSFRAASPIKAHAR
jgi:hypothetical protein